MSWNANTVLDAKYEIDKPSWHKPKKTNDATIASGLLKWRQSPFKRARGCQVTNVANQIDKLNRQGLKNWKTLKVASS